VHEGACLAAVVLPACSSAAVVAEAGDCIIEIAVVDKVAERRACIHPAAAPGGRQRQLF
jgi:hypothetical protein